MANLIFRGHQDQMIYTTEIPAFPGAEGEECLLTVVVGNVYTVTVWKTEDRELARSLCKGGAR